MFTMGDVAKHHIQKPPPIKMLQIRVVEQLELVATNKNIVTEATKTSFLRLIEHIKARPADQNWYIEILGTLQKRGYTQPFLEPGYRYQRKKLNERPILTKDQLLFYQHLPAIDQMKVMQTATPQLSKQQRAQREIKRLNEKLDELQVRIKSKKEVADESEDDELAPKVSISRKQYTQFCEFMKKI